jgi:hypothetical protein
MATQLDTLVSTTLAGAVRLSAGSGGGSRGGQVFEQAVYGALETLHPWEHCAGPDHFDMALDLVGKSGTHYEFDGAFLTHEALYVVEAKKVGLLGRQHVGIFVHKLLDVLLATDDTYRAIAIKPILITGGPKVSLAAWLHAISWGILLVSAERPTPLEIMAQLESLPQTHDTADLHAECEQLAHRIWRPIDRLVYPSEPHSLIYHIATDRILERDESQQLLNAWQHYVERFPRS